MSLMRYALLVLFLGAGCGSSSASPEMASSGSEATSPSGAGQCAEVVVAAQPTYSAPGLQLMVDEWVSIMRPLRLHAGVREPISTSIELKLELHRPDGTTSVHTFRHHNVEQVCPGCDRLRDGSGCDGPRCFDRSTGATRVELPVDWLTELGTHTLVLQRTETNERQSVTFVVGIRPGMEARACQGTPETLGPYRRVGCTFAVLPIGTQTRHIARRAQYTLEGCRLRVSEFGGQAALLAQAFQPSERATIEGVAMHRRDADGRVITAWANDPTLVWLDAARDGPEERAAIRALIELRAPLGRFQWRASRCGDARSEPPVPGPPRPARRPASGPLDIETGLERVRAIVRRQPTPGPAIRDPALERWLSELVAELARTTGRAQLPFVPGRTRVSNTQVTSHYGGCDAELIDGDLATTDARLGSMRRALVLIDGDAEIGFVRDSIVIATGRVSIAHLDDSMVVAAGGIRVSNAGRRFAEGRGGIPSILLSGSTFRGPPWAAIVGAPDGAEWRPHWRSTFVSSPAMQLAAPDATRRSDRIVLAATTISPLEGRYEAAVGPGEMPRACVYASGQPNPASCGIEGDTLTGALAGWRIAFSSSGLVVLARGAHRIRMVPGRPPLQPTPATLNVPPNAEVHLVGIYEPPIAHGVVRVEVQPRTAPVVLVLMAYEATTWEVHAAPGVEIVGVVLGGYRLSRVRGLPRGTQVVTRIQDLGEREIRSREANNPRVALGLREVFGRDVQPASFTGVEHAPRVIVVPPAR